MPPLSRSVHPQKLLKEIIFEDKWVIQTGVVQTLRLNTATGEMEGAKVLKEGGQPTVALISFGDIRVDGSIDYPTTPTVAYSPQIHDYMVQPGDILFRGRGYAGANQFGVAAYVHREAHEEALRKLRGELPHVCFAYNSSIQRIRLDDSMAKILHPEYLAAYINSPAGQRYLFKHNKGLLAITVGKSDLMNMSIALPPLSEQKKVAELFRAKAAYASHAARLLECYDLLINQVFN